MGRILDWHKQRNPEADFGGSCDPGVQSVKRIYDYYKGHGYKTIVMGASFRNLGEITALAGCDRLTISPALLDELESREGTLERQLIPTDADTPHSEPLDQATFRWQMNEDEMASDKLSEGIRKFMADQRKLENLLATLRQP